MIDCLECKVIVCHVPERHRRFLAVKCVGNDVWYHGSEDTIIDALKLCRDDEELFVVEDVNHE